MTEFRAAVFSDVHGNPFALDAVLADIASIGGVDEYWVVGDLAALGPRPVQTIERLAEIGAIATRGNTDRYCVTGDRPPPHVDDAKENPALMAQVAEIASNFAWTEGSLDATGLMPYLDRLPLEHRTILPDGTRVLAVHAAPGTDDGEGITLDQSDAELGEILASADADLVFVGHTHLHLDRCVDGVRAVNLGSVSLPKTDDLRASWSLLNARSDGYEIEHRRVDYDLQAVIDALEQTHNPSRAWLARFFRGDDPCSSSRSAVHRRA